MTSTSMTSPLELQDSSSQVPKWVWACVVGGGVALVAAGTVYYVLYGDGSSGKKKKKNAKTKKDQVEAKVKSPAKAQKKVDEVIVEDLSDDDNGREIDDPFEAAMAKKNKGNKYFKAGRYELAIKCYTEAINICPKNKSMDLATFYQNRAAAHDQLESYQSVVDDCTKALELNNKYEKALDRRAKILRKQAERGAEPVESISKLKVALEDVTSVCILGGFGNPYHIGQVDAILKELGRTEAKEAFRKRPAVLASKHFVEQYFQSFSADPIISSLGTETKQPQSNGGSFEFNKGYLLAKKSMSEENYEAVLPACTQEIDEEGKYVSEAKLLRGTFYILSKKADAAFDDFTYVIDSSSADVKLKVNALIKRASLYIQRCQDPIKDLELSLADFEKAIELDSSNSDVYHHRGQVYLLTDRVDQALRDFEKSVALSPDFATAYVQKLYTQYKKAASTENKVEVENIKNLFEEALGKFSKCVETFALYAQILSDQQQYQEADDLYERAVRIDPSNANLLVHRGLIQLQWNGNMNKAVEFMEKAIEIDKMCEFAYETLGTIEVQRGNVSRAIHLYSMAIPLANTELELAHLYGLKHAAVAQKNVTERLNIPLPNLAGMV